MKGIAARAALVATFAMLSDAVWAAPPYYFHKADVDRETFATELTECQELAGGVRAPPAPYTPYTANLYAVAVGAFLQGMTRSSERRHMRENVMRTCMTDKGYRRIEASTEVRKQLGDVPEAERADHLFMLAAAPIPAGKELPR